MSSRWALSLWLALGACVPAAEETDPAGGADVTMVPSAATTGVPFQTPDGWTVTITHVALRAMAGDSVTDPTQGNDYAGGGYGPWGVVAVTPECHLRVTGAGAGDVASIAILTASVFPNYIDTPLPPCGLDAATLKRFEELADQASTDTTSPVLPNLIIAADAVKGDRHITISAAMNLAAASPQNTAFVVIEANAGAAVRFPVNAETLFIPAEDYGVSMDEIAAADANADGIVTGVELDEATEDCVASTDGGDDDDSGSAIPTYCPTLLDKLSFTNGARFFGARAHGAVTCRYRWPLPARPLTLKPGFVIKRVPFRISWLGTARQSGPRGE